MATNSKGTSVRLHADRQSDGRPWELAAVHARRLAAVRVRSERQVRARDRPGHLWVPGRARRARRCAGQHLDRRRGVEPGHQVQSGRAGADDPWPQARSDDDPRAARRRRASGERRRRGGRGRGGARAGRRRRRRSVQSARATSPGTRRATSSSPTATAATRASRSSTRTAASSCRGARAGPSRASSTRRTRSPSMRRATSTSPTRATSAFRCSTATAPSSRRSRTSACRRRSASRAGPHQYLYSSHTGDTYGMDDAAIYKLELDGRIVGKFGKAGKQLEGIRPRQRDRLPHRERALRRRADELARAEADASPRPDTLIGETVGFGIPDPGSGIRDPNSRTANRESPTQRRYMRKALAS